MDFGKLAPWNWFKKEEEVAGQITPLRRNETTSMMPSSFGSLETEIERFFDSFKQDFMVKWPDISLIRSDWFKPSLDLLSDEKSYDIKIELPGMDASDIIIEYTSHSLRIKGEKRQQKEEKEKDYYRMERSYGSFERILDLPEDADAENISSSYKDGLLHVSIPKKAIAKKETKQIEIKTKE